MRKLIMDKSGKTGKGVFVFFGIIAVIAIVVLFMGTQQTQFGNGDVADILIDSACGIATVLDLNVVNELQQGTSVTTTINAKVNGGASQIITSSTNLKQGNELQILLNATNFIDQIYEIGPLKCGTNSETVTIKATNTQTVTIKNDADTATLTDADVGGATNESAFAAGGSKTWEIAITGSDRETTGDLYLVVELGSETNVSSMTLSDSSGNQLEKLSSVPSGLTISFIDTEGPYTVGVVDSDGSTTRFEDQFDYDFFIDA